MVYLLIANKPYKYKSGRRSHVIYIGTTGKGAHRPATSAVDKANDAFAELRGVKEIRVHIASCRGRKAMRTWEHLESALLATFRELHWVIGSMSPGLVIPIQQIQQTKRFRGSYGGYSPVPAQSPSKADPPILGLSSAKSDKAKTYGRRF